VPSSRTRERTAVVQPGDPTCPDRFAIKGYQPPATAQLPRTRKNRPRQGNDVTHGVKKIRMRPESGLTSPHEATLRELSECRSGGWGMVNRGR